VTDETLAVLRNLPRLKELSLDDSAVTDRGLAVLAGLPALESLRVARTKITPDGVAAFLASPPPRLRQIDVSGNGIQAEILRAWKEAGGGDSPRGGRRYVN
jgi:Leucine-rich repeat (LRR) protein